MMLIPEPLLQRLFELCRVDPRFDHARPVDARPPARAPRELPVRPRPNIRRRRIPRQAPATTRARASRRSRRSCRCRCFSSIRLSASSAKTMTMIRRRSRTAVASSPKTHQKAAVAGERDHRSCSIERAPPRSPPAARSPSSTDRSRSASDSARKPATPIVAGNMCAPASTVTRAVCASRSAATSTTPAGEQSSSGSCGLLARCNAAGLHDRRVPMVVASCIRARATGRGSRRPPAPRTARADRPSSRPRRKRSVRGMSTAAASAQRDRDRRRSADRPARSSGRSIAPFVNTPANHG